MARRHFSEALTNIRLSLIRLIKSAKTDENTTKNYSKNPLPSTTLRQQLDEEQQKQQTDGIASENKLS
jgi:hypothetical protein